MGLHVAILVSHSGAFFVRNGRNDEALWKREETTIESILRKDEHFRQLAHGRRWRLLLLAR
ncbi:Uncharacterized protein APZ42_034066 [Daphnia magna]|uniref:Uncharacterized protein n=1 Tax=Daphnia magna TaxID=35525 RepID=A0A164KEX5_9CRUS|nr:Uncharacterized protein APZ42_034066 [Daphnia magna]